MGERSGDRAGQGRVRIPESLKAALTLPPRWGVALSSWKMRPCCWTVGTTIGSTMSFLYRSALSVPLMTTASVLLPPYQIPAHTITLPPPYRSCSRRQQGANRCPDIRWTRTLPSWKSRAKRDSSVHITLRQSSGLQSTWSRHHEDLLLLCSAPAGLNHDGFVSCKMKIESFTLTQRNSHSWTTWLQTGLRKSSVRCPYAAGYSGCTWPAHE